MIQQVILITSLAFITGAGGILMINRRSKDELRGERWIKYFSYLAIVSTVGAAIAAHESVFCGLALLIVVTGYWELVKAIVKSRMGVLNVSMVLLIYSVLSMLFVMFALNASQSMQLLTFFIVVLFDGFSQLSGQLWGRRKLSPRISPNKTIEGAVGGTVFTMICAAYVIAAPGADAEVSAVFLLLCCPIALAGDLAASWLKRKARIKDYSNIIPGHGGVLDRFDSFIAVGAMCYAIEAFRSSLC